MYLGRVVETRPGRGDLHAPLHPYTRALLGSRPSMDPARPHRGAADHRRSAQPDRSAVRLPLPHPLPVRRGRSARRRRRHRRLGRRTAHLAACHMRMRHPATAGQGRRCRSCVRLHEAGGRPRLDMSRASAPQPLVEVDDLHGRASSAARRRCSAVNGVSFSVPPGEVLCILGESGSGKCVTLRALMRLLPPAPRADRRRDPRRRRRTCWRSSERELRDLRGGLVSMIFQEPMTALDPVYTIGTQIAETVHAPQGLQPRRRRGARAGIAGAGARSPSPERRLTAYPHELSGGLRQRAMIAMALSCRPAPAAGRRADHGARRDGADPGADPAAQAAARTRHGHDLRHPRSRRRGARSPTGSR